MNRETGITSYRCPSCDRTTFEDICLDCGVPAEPIAELPPPPPPPPPPTAQDAETPSLAESAGGDPPTAEPVATAGDPAGPATPAAEPEPAPPEPLDVAPDPVPQEPGESGRNETPAPAAPILPQAGQQQLEEYIRDGYEVFLIAGIAAAGKTQLLDAYRQDAYLAGTIKKRRGHALPTSPNTLDCHPVSVGRRKVVFVDTSGEHFKRLYPHLAPTGEIAESEIDFLRLIARNLSGVVLLVDLARLWNPAVSGGAARSRPEDEEQVNILAWVLVLLRWLCHGGAYQGRRIRFQDFVNRETMRLKKRLKIPVLALFSRADELTDLPIPSRPKPSWLEHDDEPLRPLYPAGESPLLLAYHAVPELYRALLTHTDHFRFDFVHSLVTDRDSGAVIDPTACGVSSSVAWLLDRGWRWPSIPTRTWLGLQRLVDEKLRRDPRWRRLPGPLEVG